MEENRHKKDAAIFLQSGCSILLHNQRYNKYQKLKKLALIFQKISRININHETFGPQDEPEDTKTHKVNDGLTKSTKSYIY
jgi:hypothetical protein